MDFSITGGIEFKATRFVESPLCGYTAWGNDGKIHRYPNAKEVEVHAKIDRQASQYQLVVDKTPPSGICGWQFAIATLKIIANPTFDGNIGSNLNLQIDESINSNTPVGLVCENDGMFTSCNNGDFLRVGTTLQQLDIHLKK